jgi:hypothetical protein
MMPCNGLGISIIYSSDYKLIQDFAYIPCLFFRESNSRECDI